MNRAMVASAQMNKLHVADACAKCHDQIAVEFSASAHALALRKGNVESATCTDCHGEHDIRKHTDPTSPSSAKNVAQQVCGNCHASLRLTQKYGLPSQSFQTFSDSFHGLAVRGGAVEVVNCASCHSSHGIKSQQDPTSTIHAANLVKPCGQCHEGATVRFAIGKVHVSPEAAAGKDGSSPILYLISTLYVLLTGAIIREIWSTKADRRAVVLLECLNLKEAHEHLATLPLVPTELIDFLLLELCTYEGLEQLFATSKEAAAPQQDEPPEY